MLEQEHSLWKMNYSSVAGIDEVGRGSLAGPVVAAAVIFEPFGSIPEGINDSKKLSPRIREQLYEKITVSAKAFGIGYVENTAIDKINILQATFKAMAQAVAQLRIQPDYILVDGNRMPFFYQPCKTIVKGDSLSVSIAAASIIAKVWRDRLMTELDSRFPQYGFSRNKGYGSAGHISAIRRYGLSPLHRVTFCDKLMNPQTLLW